MMQQAVLSSESEARIREIAWEVFGQAADRLRKEIMEGELGRLRLDLAEQFQRIWEVQARTEERLERLETAVQALAEAQRRTEERVNELAEAQRRTEERLERLEATVQALAEAQKRTEERVNELAEAQRRTEEQIQVLIREMIVVKADIKALKADVKALRDDMGSVKGRLLEMGYREKAPSFFGRLLRKVQVLSLADLLEELEARLSPQEVDDLLELDLLVRGRLKEGPEVWVAVEVSAVVDRHDVERALRRAALLRMPGRAVVPAVAGEEATLGAEKDAEQEGVLLILDGRCRFWDRALERVLGGA